MPSINNAFWFLSTAAAQFALLYYIVLFTAALRLRYKHKDIKRPFRVGKHPLVFWFICGIASGTCLIAFIFGFLPPPDVTNDKIMTYDMTLTGLIIAGFASGCLIYQGRQPNLGIIIRKPDNEGKIL